MNKTQTATPADVAAFAARRQLADGRLARQAGASRKALAAYAAVKRAAAQG